MLKFLGFGSSFAVKNENTSAFYIDNCTLNMFDCGESIFKIAKERNIFKDIKKVNIFLTHTHSDHCGSLGTLVFYLESIGLTNEDIFIFLPNKSLLKNLAKVFGLNRSDCQLMYRKKDFKNANVKFYKQHHNTCYSYGYLFIVSEKNYYFSGDTNELLPVILKKLINNEIEKLYIDTRLYENNNYHIGFKDIKKLIPRELRHKVVCMHLKDDFDENEIKKEGFCLPTLY